MLILFKQDKNFTVHLRKDYPHYIFISDIHGNINTLSLIKRALIEFPDAILVGGGDYIDGRKNSKEVLDFLMSLNKNKAIILKGNHEQMLLNFANKIDIAESGWRPLWYENGGKKTVRSLFGRGHSSTRSAERIRISPYYSYLQSLPVMLDTPNYIFVHAGIKPVKNYDDLSLYKSSTLDMNNNPYMFYRLWARQEYWCNDSLINNYFAHNYTNKTIITGHTPTSLITGKFLNSNLKIEKRSFTQNFPLKIQYNNEKARWFTDGGSNPKYTNNWGNVTVWDDQGNLIKIYNNQKKDFN